MHYLQKDLTEMLRSGVTGLYKAFNFAYEEGFEAGELGASLECNPWLFPDTFTDDGRRIDNSGMLANPWSHGWAIGWKWRKSKR